MAEKGVFRDCGVPTHKAASIRYMQGTSIDYFLQLHPMLSATKYPKMECKT